MSNGTTPDRDPDQGETSWVEDRTTFQRVYDVVTGLTTYQPASVVADRAQCSQDGARSALTQLTEMGIVTQRDGRPVVYRRNESYFDWKRIERLATNHTPAELQNRVDSLLEEDAELQRAFGVPDPDAVPAANLDEQTHTDIHDRLSTIARWRTIRHDIELLQRAVTQASDGHRDDNIEASA